MQIDSIEVLHLALPLKQSLETKAGSLETLETVLVRVQSGEAAGWGEASPGNAPIAGPDWAGGAFRCIKDWLAPVVVGTEVETPEVLTERFKPFHGNQFAKAAVDTAWWDLRARVEEKPLHELLDPKRDAIEVGPTFDQEDSIDDFLARIGEAFAAGFGRVKLMIRPGWDIQMLDFVRKEFPTETIFGDAEAAMGLEHSDTIYRFEDFGLDLLEQPLAADDLVGHAMIQDTLRTPICLDESITTVNQADMALELKSCRAMNIEPGRVGGLTPAIEIHNTCRGLSIPCYVGGRPQSGIGVRFGLALAAKENFPLPADFFPAEEILQADLAPALRPARASQEGWMQIPLWSEPGIGVAPSGDLLQKYAVDRAIVQ